MLEKRKRRETEDDNSSIKKMWQWVVGVDTNWVSDGGDVLKIKT